jgi:hypothetical protein
MYTRHFYYINDVKAALQYSIHKQSVQESVYWVKELMDCDNTILVQQIFFYSWFYSIGLGNLNILLDIHKPSLETIYALASIKQRNNTLPYMLVNGSLDKPYKIKKTLYKLSKNLKHMAHSNPKIDNWVRATLYGKYLESWHHSLELWNDISFQEVINQIIYIKFDNPSFIINLIEAISNLDYILLIYRKCAIIAILCMDDLSVEKGIKPLEKMDSNMNIYIECWKSTYGCRKGRAYVIKKECLYGKTARGSMTVEESNLLEIYNSEELIKGQKVYNEIINIFGSFEAFKEDSDRYDEFYDNFFHDDIPDEWSLQEQEKSHGKGILMIGEKPSFEKFFSIWVNKDSECFIPDKDIIIKEYIEKYPSKTFDFEIELIKKYDTSKFDMKSIQESIENI